MFAMRILPALILPALAAAHFHLEYPDERGFNADTISNYPCGGFTSPSSSRTEFPLSGGPIWINNEHTSSMVQVVLAVGDNPNGNDFAYVMLPTVSEIGPDDFCVPHVTVPSNANVTEGTKGTIMVVTSGHGSNQGLYACADVVFVSKNLTSQEQSNNCKNSPGVQYFPTDGSNANGSSSLTVTTNVDGDSGGLAASLKANIGYVGGAAAAGAAVAALLF